MSVSVIRVQNFNLKSLFKTNYKISTNRLKVNLGSSLSHKAFHIVSPPLVGGDEGEGEPFYFTLTHLSHIKGGEEEKALDIKSRLSAPALLRV